MQYGIQLYSVRDVSEKSLEEAIKVVSESGYSFVEFAGFFGHSAKEVTELLNKYNIGVSGAHVGIGDLQNNFEETVNFHKAIGNKYYIIPGHDLSSQEKLDEFIESVNNIYDPLEKEGITLCFHNHSQEFLPNKDGSVPFEQLLYRTNLKLEVDTYWAFVGMGDPIALLNRIKDRVVFVHIKDGSKDGHGEVLGKGEAPVKEVWNLAKALNIPMVVESETLTPDGPTEALECIKYLRSIEK